MVCLVQAKTQAVQLTQYHPQPHRQNTQTQSHALQSVCHHTLTELVQVSRPPVLAVVIVQQVGREKVRKCHELCVVERVCVGGCDVCVCVGG